MSESDDNQDRPFDVDERRIFPRPLIPPMHIGRTIGLDMHAAIKVVIGITSTVALAMIMFGVASYEMTFLNPGLSVPVYGVALLIFSFALFHMLRYIGDR
jgi:hypothetical protein